MDSGCRRCGCHGCALPRAAPAPYPARAPPPGAPRTLRGAARRSLCVCAGSVCASGSLAGRGCNGSAEWPAGPSLSAPANGGAPYIAGSVVALPGLHGSVWSRVPRAPRRRGCAGSRVRPSGAVRTPPRWVPPPADPHRAGGRRWAAAGRER